MPIKSPHFGFYSFTTGDTYSASIDSGRFHAIDNSFAFLSEVIGDGVISGLEILEDTDGSSAIVVKPGIALIDKISTRVFLSKRLNLPNNKTSYIYVRRRVGAIGQFSGFSDFYTVDYEDLSPPSSPSNLQVANIESYSVSLSWVSPDDSDLYSFEIYRRLSDVTGLLRSLDQWGQPGGSADINNDGIVDSSDLLAMIGDFILIGSKEHENDIEEYIDDSVEQNSTYSYKVRSVDLSGNKSEFTDSISVSTYQDLRRPKKPINIHIYDGSKTSQVSWMSPGDDLISYIQIRYHAIGYDHSQVGDELIVNVDMDNLNYIFLELSNSSNYKIFIKSVSINGVSSHEIEKILEPRNNALTQDVSFMRVDTIDWGGATALKIIWELPDDDGPDVTDNDPYEIDPYTDADMEFSPPVVDVPEDDDVLTKIKIIQINDDGTTVESDLMQAYNIGTASFVSFLVSEDNPPGGGNPAPEEHSILSNQKYKVIIYRQYVGILSLGRTVSLISGDFTPPPPIENLKLEVLSSGAIDVSWTNPDPIDVVDYSVLAIRYPVLEIEYVSSIDRAITIRNIQFDLDAYYLYRFDGIMLYAVFNPAWEDGVDLFIPSFEIDATTLTVGELAIAMGDIEVSPLVEGPLKRFVRIDVLDKSQDRPATDILPSFDFPHGDDSRYQIFGVVPLPGEEGGDVDVLLGDPEIVYEGTSGGVSLFKVTADMIETSSQYDFEIKSIDARGNESTSVFDSVLIQSAEFFDRPGYPRNLYVSPGDGFVLLNWSPPQNMESIAFFSLYRSDANLGIEPENFIRLDTITSDLYQYIDYTAQNDITYIYMITSMTSYGVESVNPVDDGRIVPSLVYMTPRISGTMEAPYDLLVDVDGDDATLTWKCSQDSFDGFEIYRSINSKVNFEIIETLSGNIKEYKDVDGLFRTGTYRYMVRKVVNEGDIGFTEINEVPSFSEFVASVTINDGNVTVDRSVGRDLSHLNTPIREIAKEITDIHRHYKISELDDRRINFSEGISISDWVTGPHDGKVWSTSMDLSTFDPSTKYQLYIDDEIARMLYYLDFETGILTLERTLGQIPDEPEGGGLPMRYLVTSLTFPSLKVTFESNEFDGVLSASFVESVSATQFTKNQLTHDMIPEMQHDGRIGEDLVPLTIKMATMDGYSFYGILDEDGEEIQSLENSVATSLKLWDDSTNLNSPIIFYDLIYFDSSDVMWACTSSGVLYSTDFGVTWSTQNRATISTSLAPHKFFRSEIYPNRVFTITNRSVFVSSVPGSERYGYDTPTPAMGSFTEVIGISASSVIRDITEVSVNIITEAVPGIIIEHIADQNILINLFEFRKSGNYFESIGIDGVYTEGLGFKISVNNLTLIELKKRIDDSVAFIIGDVSVYFKDLYSVEVGDDLAGLASSLVDTDWLLDEGQLNFQIIIPRIDPRSGIFFSTNLGIYRLRYDVYGINPELTQRQIFGSSTTNAYAMFYDNANDKLLISTDSGLIETDDGGDTFMTVSDLSDQEPIYMFVEEGEYVFAIANQSIYRRDPGRKDFVEIFYTEDFYIRKAVIHYGRMYVTTSMGLMVNKYGDSPFSSSSIDLISASGVLKRNGKDLAVHSINRISDKLFAGSESALFISTSSSIFYNHWMDDHASVPTVYINGEEQKIGWYLLCHVISSGPAGEPVSISNSLTFDEKYTKDDFIEVARQYRRFRAKNGGWVDLDFAAAVLMYINGHRVNDGSRAEKPIYAISDVIQKDRILTDTISHLEGAEKHLSQVKQAGNFLISNQLDSDGNSQELGYLGFTRQNVRFVNNLIDKFNSQTYFTDPKDNSDITDKTKMSLPEFKVYLIGGSYSEERMISYLGYQDFGDYPEETMVGSISTIDEEDIDWLMVDGTAYGDGDSGSDSDDGLTPTGACCLGDNCFSMTEAVCVALGGDYKGDGTRCWSYDCTDGGGGGMGGGGGPL